MSELLSKSVANHTPINRIPIPLPIQRLQQAVLGCLVLLVVLGLWQELYLDPVGYKTLALKVLPWMLAMPAVYRHRLYTFRVISLLLWLYVPGPVLGFGAFFVSGTGQTLVLLASAAQLGLCLLLFVLCVCYVRMRLANGCAHHTTTT